MSERQEAKLGRITADVIDAVYRHIARGNSPLHTEICKIIRPHVQFAELSNHPVERLVKYIMRICEVAWSHPRMAMPTIEISEYATIDLVRIPKEEYEYLLRIKAAVEDDKELQS